MVGSTHREGAGREVEFRHRLNRTPTLRWGLLGKLGVAVRAFVGLIALALLIGCSSVEPLPPGPTTPDFTLTLNARTLGSAGEVVQAYTFVLEPDRTLRVAIGPGCTLDTYPDPTIMLSVRQVQTVYDLTRQLDFDARSGDVSGDGSNAEGRHVISTLVVSRGQRLRAVKTVPIRSKQALATEPSARLFSTLLAYGLVSEQSIAPAAPATDP